MDYDDWLKSDYLKNKLIAGFKPFEPQLQKLIVFGEKAKLVPLRSSNRNR